MEGVRILGAVQGSLFETVEPVVSTCDGCCAGHDSGNPGLCGAV